MDKVYDIYLGNGVSENHVRTLNTLLSTSKTFTEGLQILKNILKYCGADFHNENLTTWLDYCLKKHTLENVREMQLCIIGECLEISSNNQELIKKIGAEYLSKIVELCLTTKINYYEIKASLDVLTICMKKYSSWFANHKTRIEVYILTYLEIPSHDIVEKAAVAFLYLQQTGNAGVENINHKHNFRISLQKLCSTMHNLFDVFLENEIEVDPSTYLHKPNEEGLKFEKAVDDLQKKMQITARRINNVICFLIVMLKEKFTVHKEIVPIEILNVIRRGTKNHLCTSTSNTVSLEDYQFSKLQNDIQVQLLHLLRVLILWLQNNSFPFSFIISKILLDCLKASKKCKCFSLDCVYEETLYVVLKYWINTSKCSLNSHFQIELIDCILKDITPVKNVVTLKSQFERQRKKGHKQKSTKNTSLSCTEAANEINKSKHEMNKEELRCQLALDTLKILFCDGFIRVNQNVVNKVYTLIITIFNEIKTSKLPHPYINHKSQLKLHEVLVSFYHQDTFKYLPSIGLSLNILNNSSCSKNNDITAVCKEGLNNLERICQPVSIPFSTFSTLQVEPCNSDRHISEDVVLMECITDITESECDTHEEVCLDTDVKEERSNSVNEVVSTNPDLQANQVSETKKVAVDEIIKNVNTSQDEPSPKRGKFDTLSSSELSNIAEEMESFIDELQCS